MNRNILLILSIISLTGCNREQINQETLNKLKQSSSFSKLSGDDDKKYFNNIALVMRNNRLDFFSYPEETKPIVLELTDQQRVFYNKYAGVIGEIENKYEPDLIYESEPRTFTWGISYCRKKQPWLIDWNDERKEFYSAGSGSYDVIENINEFDCPDNHYLSGPKYKNDKIKDQYLLNSKYYAAYCSRYIKPDDVSKIITNTDIQNILLAFIYYRDNEISSIVSEKKGLTIEGWDEPDHYNLSQISELKNPDQTNRLDNLSRFGSNIICMLYPSEPINIYQNCFISEDIVTITKSNNSTIVVELITNTPSKITLMFTIEDNKIKLFYIRNFIDTE